jgi:hypothetical protein
MRSATRAMWVETVVSGRLAASFCNADTTCGCARRYDTKAACRKNNATASLKVQLHCREIGLALDAVASPLLPYRYAHFFERSKIAVDCAPINAAPFGKVDNTQATNSIVEQVFYPAQTRRFAPRPI